MASLRKRGKVYYASYYVNSEERRTSLDTTSCQVVKEWLRNFEGARARNALDDVLPTKTPVAKIVSEYAAYIKGAKSRNGVKVDFWYLRRIFGPVCPLFSRESGKTPEKKMDHLQLLKKLSSVSANTPLTLRSNEQIHGALSRPVLVRFSV